jgi:hypothetical protein
MKIGENGYMKRDLPGRINQKIRKSGTVLKTTKKNHKDPKARRCKKQSGKLVLFMPPCRSPLWLIKKVTTSGCL